MQFLFCCMQYIMERIVVELMQEGFGFKPDLRDTAFCLLYRLYELPQLPAFSKAPYSWQNLDNLMPPI